MQIVPFDTNTLKNIISGELVPEVDYLNSKIKGKNLITYFSNLKYKDIILCLNDVSKQEKFELLTEYIKHQSIVNIQQLQNTVVKVIFSAKNFDLSLVDASELDVGLTKNCILNNDEILEYVSLNTELVNQLVDLLDGVLLYAIKSLNGFSDEVGDQITTNIVVDKTDIGKTFVNLFSNETFNYYYYAAVPDFKNLKYFEYYFDRPIYSGQILLSFLQKDCVIFPLLSMVLEQQFSATQLKEIQEYATSI